MAIRTEERLTSEEVARIVKDSKLTQEEFAREIDSTFSTVNRWINGHARPSKVFSKVIREFALNHGLIQQTGPLYQE